LQDLVVGHRLMLVAQEPSAHKIWSWVQLAEMMSTIWLQYSLDFWQLWSWHLIGLLAGQVMKVGHSDSWLRHSPLAHL